MYNIPPFVLKFIRDELESELVLCGVTGWKVEKSLLSLPPSVVHILSHFLQENWLKPSQASHSTFCANLAWNKWRKKTWSQLLLQKLTRSLAYSLPRVSNIMHLFSPFFILSQTFFLFSLLLKKEQKVHSSLFPSLLYMISGRNEGWLEVWRQKKLCSIQNTKLALSSWCVCGPCSRGGRRIVQKSSFHPKNILFSLSLFSPCFLHCSPSPFFLPHLQRKSRLGRCKMWWNRGPT